ncbi:MAG: signal recognition particle-docking protein FtsY [Bifidobacteriaceae bacterium]|jgi:fused signal recognition particle receptor|nr:signal recognition particle-docking protein FtsY [Bifidobacteriaceae bacterium]
MNIYIAIMVVIALAIVVFFIYIKYSKGNLTTVDKTSKQINLFKELSAKSKIAPSLRLSTVFKSGKSLDEVYKSLANKLILSDMGTVLTDKIIQQIKQTKPKTAAQIKVQAKTFLLDILTSQKVSGTDNSIPQSAVKPAIYLFVGVNGVGKTTTLGKIAKKNSFTHPKQILAAADTFRAAAQDQLDTWAKAVGAQIIKGESKDPASVAYKAVDMAIRENYDSVFIDTAGRLHNKTNLVEELKKIIRVVEKLAPITATYLVLDAMTGQNGLQQAKVFTQAVKINGVILTKMDGTAKGGVIFSIQSQLGVSVKYIGLGEGVDNLLIFNPDQFIDSILN